MEPTATYDNLVKGGRGRLRLATDEVKSFVMTNSVTYLPLILLLRSMNTVKSEMENLQALKAYVRTGLTETVKASSLYNNANKLYKDANHFLHLAGTQIWRRFEKRICCSYCGLESVRGHPCIARIPATAGYLSIRQMKSKQVNLGPHNLVNGRWNYETGSYNQVWPTEWFEVQQQGGCQTNGGHYTGQDLSIITLKRDSEGMELPSQVVSAIPWSKRDQLL